jgi:hypothetical protein
VKLVQLVEEKGVRTWPVQIAHVNVAELSIEHDPPNDKPTALIVHYAQRVGWPVPGPSDGTRSAGSGGTWPAGSAGGGSGQLVTR